jgi:ABC-type phosphate transport system substrate-binding protein
VKPKFNEMMKAKTVLLGILMIALSFGTVQAENTGDGVGAETTITVRSAKFGRKLVETWIAQYSQLHPGVKFRLVDNAKEEVDLELRSEAGADEATPTVAVGRFALLPVSTLQNPLHEQLAHKSFNAKELKRLYFQNDIVQEVENSKKKDAWSEGLTVYSATNRTSGAGTFAAHFGYETAQLRGKRIAGDDLFLLTAIQKDQTGITFNNLTYLYDLDNRRLKAQLFVLPLDVKKEQEDVLQSGDLDATLQLLEAGGVDLVPVENVEFVYRNANLVAPFVAWIVSEGQQYNHAQGFLTLDKKQAEKEQKQFSLK